MIIDWIKHLPEDKKGEFKSVILNSKQVLDRLRDIITEYENELNRMERTVDAYESPSWSHRQAHLNGRLQELNRIKQLLTM